MRKIIGYIFVFLFGIAFLGFLANVGNPEESAGTFVGFVFWATIIYFLFFRVKKKQPTTRQKRQQSATNTAPETTENAIPVVPFEERLQEYTEDLQGIIEAEEVTQDEAAELLWGWEDDFNAEEKARIIKEKNLDPGWQKFLTTLENKKVASKADFEKLKTATQKLSNPSTSNISLKTGRIEDVLGAIAADKKVNVQEVSFLVAWIKEKGLAQTFPFDGIYQFCQDALADGKIDKHEEQQFLKFAESKDWQTSQTEQAVSTNKSEQFTEAGSAFLVPNKAAKFHTPTFCCKVEGGSGDYLITCGTKNPTKYNQAGFFATCDCTGFLYYGACKHLSALLSGHTDNIQKVFLGSTEALHNKVPEDVVAQIKKMTKSKSEEKKEAKTGLRKKIASDAIDGERLVFYFNT